MKEHSCKYRFWRWLITLATANKKVYWLLWGMIAVMAICAYKFGFAGVF